MKNWCNRNDASALLQRLEGLKPDARPLWGSMTASVLLCHLADPVRIALREKTAKRTPSPLGMPVMADLAVWVMPWPKGSPTAPEFLPGSGMTPPTTFEQDKRTLLEVMQRFSSAPPSFEWGSSPVFGKLSRSAWGRMIWRHMDHHLRQFGL